MPPPAQAPTQSPSAAIGYNLGAIALALALLGLGAAYLIEDLGRAARPGGEAGDTGLTFTRTIGGQDLEIPAHWLRYEEQKVEGFARQIDLRLALPLGNKDAPVTIDITLLPRSRVRPSSSLLDGVYLHQFMPEQLTGPPGLIGKPLKGSEGYAGEVVWYDALAADPFVAKCSKAAPEASTAQCIRTVYLGPGMAAIYAFPDSALGNWARFDAEMGTRLKQIGAI